MVLSLLKKENPKTHWYIYYKTNKYVVILNKKINKWRDTVITSNWNLSDRNPTCLKLKICNWSSNQWNLNHFTHSNPPSQWIHFFLPSTSTNPTPQWADWGWPCLATHWCEVWCMGGGGFECSYLLVIQVFFKPGPQVCRGLCVSGGQIHRFSSSLTSTPLTFLMTSSIFWDTFSPPRVPITHNGDCNLSKKGCLSLKIFCVHVHMPCTIAQVPREGKVVYQVLHYLSQGFVQPSPQ